MGLGDNTEDLLKSIDLDIASISQRVKSLPQIVLCGSNKVGAHLVCTQQMELFRNRRNGRRVKYETPDLSCTLSLNESMYVKPRKLVELQGLIVGCRY